MDDSIHPKQEVDIDFSQLPQGSFYLKIWGEDKDGIKFYFFSQIGFCT